MADSHPHVQKVGRGGEIALAVTGGIFGIIGGLFGVMVGAAQTGVGDQSVNVGGLGWAAVVLSALAIISVAFVNSRPQLAGWLLLVAAIGGLISISFFYILPFILLVIAGLMCLLRGRKSKR